MDVAPVVVVGKKMNLYQRLSITLAAFLVYLLYGGIMFNLGVYYAAFTEQFNVSNGTTAVISSLLMFISTGLSVCAAILINKFGCRLMVVMGGLFAGTGLFLSFFSTDIYHLCATYSVLTGFGLVLIYNASTVYLSYCFTGKEFSMVLGGVTTGISVGSFIYPHLSIFLLDVFGWRGALMITGALTFNVCALAGLFAKDHEHFLTESSNSSKKTNEKFRFGSTNTVTVISHSRVNGDKEGTRKKLVHFDIFKNISYLIICFSTFLLMFSMSMMYIHIGAFAQSNNFTPEDGAMLMTVLGVSNTFGRVILGILSSLKNVDSLILYVFCMFSCGLSMVTCPHSVSSIIIVSTCVAGFGFFIAALGSIWPQLILMIVGSKKMSFGIGICLTIGSIGIVLGGPVAGWIYDAQRSYVLAFYIGGSMLFVSGSVTLITWQLEKWKWDKAQEKPLKRQTDESSDTSQDQSCHYRLTVPTK